ncbi:molybdenum cofactor guanylyltransferase [Salisediminibacterium halotolerans]|uniref:Probable molybdenum cofactor guanylyltransferase n=1 Tax=Salisediminibacterium halotolerans TaxID=517425 RepID=A0A1H9UWP8_9BACI|nr:MULTISPECIES: molybdenum cofactor guanylyltransferase [Salisediminibacterium]RLJ80879.1 molybdenum cofactor guanylyltransferase [Actinophytocola xinjiangensis]RPE83935.1 molybdenum cofactor guanylyltransferase [Salisediminibacterium halotolerans]TWG37823.1 molybdenum cofactor guanylyltransferase [Salisediminibacterium halotolerans]SES13751.1 FdhD protein/molybdopterin-guanine dinucleotide biosynthesis protein A [Salisediminibacterium haloalkalitolerans]GEL09050.1 hypothetical protein SHA02_
MEQLTGAVLAGGESRRMGANKALLTIGGEALVERLIAVLSEETDRMLLVTNQPDQFSFLRTEKVIDRYPGCGPLAGLDAAFSAVSGGWVFLSSCDLPFPDLRVVRALIEKADTGNGQAVVPEIHGVKHPLFALYHYSLQAKVEKKLADGEHRMTGLLEETQVTYLNAEFFRNLGMTDEDISKAFYNMNRPEDYQWAKNQ